MCKKFIDFHKATVVKGNGGIKQMSALCIGFRPEFYSCNGSDSGVEAGPVEIEYAGTAVDVGENQGFNAVITGKYRKLFRRNGAVAQRVIGVAVEVHLFVPAESMDSKVSRYGGRVLSQTVE